MSGAAAARSTPAARLRRDARLVLRAAEYEWRKAAVFRVGFLVREVLHGVARPVAMIVLFHALYRSSGEAVLGGWELPELVRYMILVALFRKVLFHERLLDVSRQIFEGYVTKYLVMPFPFFTLALGRFVQFTALQLPLVALLWLAGALLLPGWWPQPPGVVPLLQGLTLLLLGSYCFLLLYFVVEALAFWLDVVWSLMVMTGFVTSFVAGAHLPVSMMPPALGELFRWLFPYWALSAPIEILLGRLGTDAFLRGCAVLGASIAALELLRRVVWARGSRQYAGGGM